ncbi:hypothetical protein [Methanochimaera problematica]|nr:hypothetical protein [Methanoplanus sp. FWC-SCC4]
MDNEDLMERDEDCQSGYYTSTNLNYSTCMKCGGESLRMMVSERDEAD